MKKTSIFDLQYILIGIPWLFMMIATSRGFTAIKTGMLMALSFVALLEFLVKRKKILKNELSWLLLFLTYYFCSLVLGIFLGYEFSFSTDFALIQYYFITPLLVFLLSTIFTGKNDRLQFVLSAVELICFFVVVLDLAKILTYRIGTPDIDIFNLIMIASNNTDSELAIRVSNEASLMFLLPIIVVLFFDKEAKGSRRIVHAMTIIIGITYCLISGRKMLELVVFGTIALMLLRELRSLSFKRILHVVEFGIGGYVLLFVVGKLSGALNIDNIIGRAFDTLVKGLARNSYGITHRVENIRVLLEMWKSSPVFGHGLNSYAVDSIANGVTKWSYEVLYNALLAQVGVIGVIVLFVGIYYIIINLYKTYKKTNEMWLFAACIGFFSFVICGGSNPLLYYIWPWIICLSLVHKKGNLQNEVR